MSTSLSQPTADVPAHPSTADHRWLPLSRYGRREMIWLTVASAVVGIGAGMFWWPASVIVLVLWLGGIAFFRDPAREIPRDPSAYLSPADGTVTEITPIEHDDRIGGRAVLIGIFLSVLDVHMNRSPCRGVVRSVAYRRGAFHNAMSKASSTDNESNTVVLDGEPPLGPVVVKQIAGVIARRIVCAARSGDAWEAGQRFGMIKFGSRTELVIARPDELEIVVQVGDKVRAGRTIVARRLAASPTASNSAGGAHEPS